jgi:putative addiction module component (TIGR02574 family)
MRAGETLMGRKVTVEDTLEMSVADRIKLAQDIWDTVAADSGPVPVSEAERQEIERRLDEHERDPHATIPWAEVKKQILGGK